MELAPPTVGRFQPLASLLDHLCGGACCIRTLNRVLPLDASLGILAWESR
jgi:hypothetical protein